MEDGNPSALGSAPLSQQNVADFEKMLMTRKINQIGMIAEMKADQRFENARDQRRYDMFKNAIKDGEMGSRTSAGNAFRKYLQDDPRAGAEYAKKRQDERQQQRAEWVSAQYKEMRDSRTLRKSFSRIDIAKGTFLPLGRIIIDEGGWSDPEAVQAGYNLAVQCHAMGGDWWMINPQTNRINYLRMSYEWQETFAKSWSLLKERAQTLDFSKDEDKASEAEQPEVKKKGRPRGKRGAAVAKKESKEGEKPKGKQTKRTKKTDNGGVKDVKRGRKENSGGGERHDALPQEVGDRRHERLEDNNSFGGACPVQDALRAGSLTLKK